MNGTQPVIETSETCRAVEQRVATLDVLLICMNPAHLGRLHKSDMLARAVLERKECGLGLFELYKGGNFSNGKRSVVHALLPAGGADVYF